jgi:hypothetical protein
MTITAKIYGKNGVTVLKTTTLTSVQADNFRALAAAVALAQGQAKEHHGGNPLATDLQGHEFGPATIDGVLPDLDTFQRQNTGPRLLSSANGAAQNDKGPPATGLRTPFPSGDYLAQAVTLGMTFGDSTPFDRVEMSGDGYSAALRWK